MKRKLIPLLVLFLIGITANAAATKAKVIIDNDFCGDPDGLFQLVHHALIPSTEIVGVIGGHLDGGHGFTSSADQATESVEKARRLLTALGIDNLTIVKGSEKPMASAEEPMDSEGAQLIIAEARKATPEKPLYVCCGAALTNVASALLMAPEISKNIVIVWIGGQEYDFGAPVPPGGTAVEYNLSLSIPAAQVVFGKSDVRLWQVPRDAYRQCIYSISEMHAKIAPCGEVGKMLSDGIDKLFEVCEQLGMAMGEGYVLGDSPLVLLSSLQCSYESDASSSQWKAVQCPEIADDGSYLPNPDGRTIRVYTHIDTRLMFADMESRLQLAAN